MSKRQSQWEWEGEEEKARKYKSLKLVTSKKKETEEEEWSRSVSTPKEREIEEEERRRRLKYEREHIFNVTEFFSSLHRDFLLRSNGDKVKAYILKGKIIGIHLWQVSEVIKNPELKLAVDLLDAYEEHYSKGDFEVVSIAIMEKEDRGLVKVEEEAVFNQRFSRMPWLAIPFSDIETRRRLTNEFMIPHLWNYESCSFLGANGKLLQKYADNYLYEFGADYYPFTDQRVKEAFSDKESHFQLEISSIHSLLAAPNRDFLISNQGNKIPISELEGKVIGLYLYGSMRSLRLLPKLHYIYNELKVTRRASFEIVFVNLHFSHCGYGDEESFKAAFGNMPWLALPFKDKMCRRLWRKYNRYCDYTNEDGVFVVISSNGKAVDPYGAKVIIEYGVEAYPFTREKAAKIEKEMLKQTRIIPRIMAYQRSLIRRDGSKVHVAKIFGKNILLFVGAVKVSTTLNFLPELLIWYREIKNKDDNFEVIYLSRDEDRAMFNDVFQKMPWLTFPYRSEHRPSAMLDDVQGFYNERCYLIALGRDGRIVSKDAAKHLRDRGADAYPFKDDDLLDDVRLELAKRLVWLWMDKDGLLYCPCDYPCPSPRYTNRFVSWVESKKF